MTTITRFSLSSIALALLLSLGLTLAGCAKSGTCEHCKADTSPPDKVTEKAAPAQKPASTENH